MTQDQLLEALGKILAGLQVPLSLDPRILGAASDPYREILRDAGFGWRNQAEFTDYLRRALTPDAAVTGETTP